MLSRVIGSFGYMVVDRDSRTPSLRQGRGIVLMNRRSSPHDAKRKRQGCRRRVAKMSWAATRQHPGDPAPALRCLASCSRRAMIKHSSKVHNRRIFAHPRSWSACPPAHRRRSPRHQESAEAPAPQGFAIEDRWRPHRRRCRDPATGSMLVDSAAARPNRDRSSSASILSRARRGYKMDEPSSSILRNHTLWSSKLGRAHQEDHCPAFPPTAGRRPHLISRPRPYEACPSS